MPIRGGHLQSSFSDGNRACCYGDGCGAEMFFSYLFLLNLYMHIWIRGAKLSLFFHLHKYWATFFPFSFFIFHFILTFAAQNNIQ
jgi:hypothetical protein